MRALAWLTAIPVLVAATCSPSPYGGALEEISIDEEGPLYFDATDERFTDAPPSIAIVLTRDSDGVEATSELSMTGNLAAGFSFSEDRTLELPEGPCEDTRAMSARFRLVTPADWAESVEGQFSEETADLFLTEESVQEIALWESWGVSLTPGIVFPTERIHRDDLPLECWDR